MSKFSSTKIIELGSCAFRQWRATSHCNKLHGYRLSAKFTFACSSLDENHWCLDFGGLKNLKEKLEEQFDHTTCIAADDPELNLFFTLHEKKVIDLRVMNAVGIEAFAKFCAERAEYIVNKDTKGRCWVSKVEVWEHEKNSAIYYPEMNSLPVASISAAPGQLLSIESKPHVVQDLPEAPKINDTGVQTNTASMTKPAAFESNFTPKPQDPNFDKAAPLHNTKVRGSFSDPFKGTSWGNKN